MSKLISVLGVALALQLLLALSLGLGGRDFGATAAGGPLLSFDRKAVDRVRILPSGQDPVLLERRDGAWQIPSLQGFPVAQTRIDDLLSRLTALQRRLPVGTSAEAAKRFKVSPDAFERKLELLAGERVLATLWLGDAAGARRAYLRVDGDDQVFEAALASHDLGAKPDDWAAPDYLHLKSEDITRLEVNGLTLEWLDGAWRVAGLGEGEATDPERISALVRQVARMDFMGVLGTEPGPGYGPEIPSQRLTVGLKTGAPRIYQLWKRDESKDYVVQSSSAPYYFKVPDYAGRELAGISLDKLRKAPAAAVPEPQAAPLDLGQIPDLDFLDDEELPLSPDEAGAAVQQAPPAR